MTLSQAVVPKAVPPTIVLPTIVLPMIVLRSAGAATLVALLLILFGLAAPMAAAAPAGRVAVVRAAGPPVAGHAPGGRLRRLCSRPGAL
ncbi:MAG: hypothetical protein K0R87_2030, partial [Pseudonocardia sp.]|nr:hypothetical protein [Pseudonocardia sp.]